MNSNRDNQFKKDLRFTILFVDIPLLTSGRCLSNEDLGFGGQAVQIGRFLEDVHAVGQRGGNSRDQG